MFVLADDMTCSVVQNEGSGGQKVNKPRLKLVNKHVIWCFLNLRLEIEVIFYIKRLNRTFGPQSVMSAHKFLM